ncbi:hypothetical protein LXL04_007575 [Taraxacum kok-saghyz]
MCERSCIEKVDVSYLGSQDLSLSLSFSHKVPFKKKSKIKAAIVMSSTCFKCQPIKLNDKLPSCQSETASPAPENTHPVFLLSLSSYPAPPFS